MTKQHFSLLALAVAAALVVTAGCGSSSSAETTLTKAAFLKKADIVCEAASREQGELAVDYIKEHPGAKETDYVEPAAIPPLEKQIRELKALGMPKEDEAGLAAYLERFERDLAEAKEDPAGMLSEAHNPFAQTIKLGKKYGFTDCAVLP